MLISIFDGKTGRKNEPEYVIASFSLHSYPRFKSGYSSDYIGWSKPTISVRQLESLQIGQLVRFGGENVRVADRSGDSITLQFESIYDKEKQETRTVSLNEPVETGYVADLYDASHSFYFGCWTSWRTFLKYYLGVKWDRWVDDRRAQIIRLPTHYSAKAIKRRWKIRWLGFLWKYWRGFFFFFAGKKEMRK